MDGNTIVQISATWAAVAMAWLDMRKRTNGNSPIAEAVKENTKRLDAVESKLAHVRLPAR